MKGRKAAESEFRSATNADTGFLIPLVAESSGGVWPAIWRSVANEGESVAASAIRYLTDGSNKLCIRNTILTESNGSRIGAMIAYREENLSSSEKPVSLPADLHDALQPYRELSDPDSLFISELCLLPEARGQGVGTRLLEHASVLAMERSLPRVSLRVFSTNAGAVRLYTRSGFRIDGEREVVAHPDILVDGLVYLMSRPV